MNKVNSTRHTIVTVENALVETYCTVTFCHKKTKTIVHIVEYYGEIRNANNYWMCKEHRTWLKNIEFQVLGEESK